MIDVAAEIDAVLALPPAELRRLWRRRYRRDPPVGLPLKLLREAFIYRLQEQALGGLSAQSLRRLDKLAAKVEADPSAPVCGDSALRPGARLVREWRGRRYEVDVLETGFGLNGEVYNSLTEIAFVITGTKWSGPRFFGLKGKRQT